MPYGQVNADTIQSSTAGTPPVFKDGSGNEIGTLCRAWVNFNGLSGASPVIRASFNVSSISYYASGNYGISFTNALTDANYSIEMNCRHPSYHINSVIYPDGSTNGVARVFAYNSSFSATTDAQYVCVSIFR